MQEKKEKEEQKSQEARQEKKLSETWAQDALGDLEDWIEEQGIYIRQWKDAANCGLKVDYNSSAQDFAFAAKSVRMHKFRQRIQPFVISKL